MIPGRHYLSTLDLHQPDEINPISFTFAATMLTCVAQKQPA